MRFQAAENDTIVELGQNTKILELNEKLEWISTYDMWSGNAPMPTI